MKKESRYAVKLRGLGFERVTPEIEAYQERRMELRIKQHETRTGINVNPKSFNRKRRRVFDKLISKYFIIFEGDPGDTLARDETGKLWQAGKKVDLRHLGFKDHTAHARLTQTVLPPLQQPKLN